MLNDLLNPKNNLIQKEKIINFLTILLFCFYFFIGINIYKDYGFSIDEPFQRTSGYYWYIWIINNFFENYSNIESLQDSFNKMEWSSEMLEGTFLEYGVFFDLLAVIIEDQFNLKSYQDIYHAKHLLNFSFFFLSSVCFFYLVKFRFKNTLLPLIGTIFYITTPRIFAESFYNSKDIIFMCLTVFAIFFCLKTLKNYKIKNIILFSFFAALATSLRTMGIFIILLFIIFFILESFEIKNFFIKKINLVLATIFLYLVFTYILWPFLWTDPINNFFTAFQFFKKYQLGVSTSLYLGKYINTNYLPWHYTFVWIAVSSPIIYSFFFLIGSLNITYNFIKNFLEISINDYAKKLWKSSNEKIDLFILIFFMGPIFAIIIFQSNLYNGWRHLYFIYPALIYLIVYAINFLMKFNISKISKNSFFLIIIFLIIFNIFNLVKFHPYQNVYFNYLFEKNANNLFDVDYWGLGNAQSLKKILNNTNKTEKISIGVASFTPLAYSRYIINDKKINNVLFSGTTKKDQDYFITNYIYDRNPKFLKKYSISKKYKKFFTLKRGNIIINEIYKKK
tara:strand:- start:4301 stop:5989 length:1689 start_codon:yes stop_codon:yes gene_type:complete